MNLLRPRRVKYTAEESAAAFHKEDNCTQIEMMALYSRHLTNLAATASTIGTAEVIYERATTCLDASVNADLLPQAPDELTSRAKEHYDCELGKEMICAGKIKCQIVSYYNKLVVCRNDQPDMMFGKAGNRGCDFYTPRAGRGCIGSGHHQLLNWKRKASRDMQYPDRAKKCSKYVTCRPCARHITSLNQAKIKGEIAAWVEDRTDILCDGTSDSFGVLPGEQHVGEDAPIGYLLQLERLYLLMQSADRSGSNMLLSSTNELEKRDLWDLFIERLPLKQQFSKEELDFGKTKLATLHSVARPHIV